MLIEPIEEGKAQTALPARSEAADGLFSWGLPKLRGGGLTTFRLECAVVFFILPLVGILIGARSMIPLIIFAMMSSTIFLLSATRNFHWRDLLPVDPFSEWRLVLTATAGFAALSLILTAILAPDRNWDDALAAWPMLLAFPFLTAAPVELVHRVLFFRRFGHLFPNATTALLFGGASNALVYFMLSGTISGAIFGAMVGFVVGRVYLLTGQFALSATVHWIAAICIFLLGPGFLIF